MNIIIDTLPSGIADQASVRIVSSSNWYGYCENGIIPDDSPILPFKDFTLDGQETVSSTQETTVASTGNKMVIPIYCHDYGGWCEVEITLKKNGTTIDSPIKLTLPHDGNGDRLADRWQDTEITAWNTQFGDTRPLEDAERGKMKPGTGYDLADYADDEMKKSDGASGSMPAMADEGDVLKVMEEYRGFILDAGPGITSTEHRRLSIARKEALFQFLVMPQITDGSNPGNCANTAAQGFDAAQRFQAVHAFYKSKYPNGGADLDCYMVKLPLIPNASTLVPYLDGTTRPAYLLDTKLNPIAGHTRPANALTYVYLDRRLFDKNEPLHNVIYGDLHTASDQAFAESRSAAEIIAGPRALDRFTVCAFYNRFGFYSSAANWNLGVNELHKTSFSNHLPGGTLSIPMVEPAPWKRGCQFAVNAISENPADQFSSGRMEYAIAHEIGHTLIWGRDAAHPGSPPGLMAEGPYHTSLSPVVIDDPVINRIDLRNRSSVVK